MNHSHFNYMKSKLFTVVVIGTLAVAGSLSAQAQSWTQHVDWSATNSDVGGSVDCPQQYFALGVPEYIASGGRSAVINEALFAAYRGDVGRAYQLVLLTQCHNPGAQGELIQAGQNAVVGYLVRNWTPNGVDPQTVIQGVQLAVSILGGN
jgi:hypothetical protein